MLSGGMRLVHGDSLRDTEHQESIQSHRHMDNSTEDSEKILQGGMEGPQKSGWRYWAQSRSCDDEKDLGIMERKRGLQIGKGREETVIL